MTRWSPACRWDIFMGGALKPDAFMANSSYVRQDDHGVYRVGCTRVMLDSLVAAFRSGCSPETIRAQYPALALEEVYGTITFYLANRERIDEYLKHQDVIWQEGKMRAEQQG